jgi:ABC-type transporter Mla subunit MlaD
MIPLPVFPAVDAQPLADVLVPYLKRILMNQAELKTALDSIGTALGSVATQLEKATNEIIIAIQNAGSTTPEVDAAVANLQAVATALTTASQSLDDLNPDAPAVP